MTDSHSDKLLDAYGRIVAQNGALSGHLWAAEHYLTRVVALLPRLAGDSEACDERDELTVDVLGFLQEDREHPGLPDEAASRGEREASSSGDDSEGEVA
jgi:hypothetical protein